MVRVLGFGVIWELLAWVQFGVVDLLFDSISACLSLGFGV